MRWLVCRHGEACCGPGGRTDVNPVFEDERGFVHQPLAVVDEVVKGPAHLLSAIAEYYGGVIGDTPDDM